MSDMNYYWDKQKEAADKVRLFLEDTELETDPWDVLLPCFYGTYSKDFDDLAISGLSNGLKLPDVKHERGDEP